MREVSRLENARVSFSRETSRREKLEGLIQSFLVYAIKNKDSFSNYLRQFESGAVSRKQQNRV